MDIWSERQRAICMSCSFEMSRNRYRVHIPIIVPFARESEPLERKGNLPHIVKEGGCVSGSGSAALNRRNDETKLESPN